MRKWIWRSSAVLLAGILGIIAGLVVIPGHAIGMVGGCPDLEDFGGPGVEIWVDAGNHRITANYADGRQVALSVDVDAAKCTGEKTRKLVAETQASYQESHQSLCTHLIRIVAGAEPVPVKGGHEMNMQAVKDYLSNRCTSKIGP